MQCYKYLKKNTFPLLASIKTFGFLMLCCVHHFAATISCLTSFEFHRCKLANLLNSREELLAAIKARLFLADIVILMSLG